MSSKKILNHLALKKNYAFHFEHFLQTKNYFYQFIFILERIKCFKLLYF